MSFTQAQQGIPDPTVAVAGSAAEGVNTSVVTSSLPMRKRKQENLCIEAASASNIEKKVKVGEDAAALENSMIELPASITTSDFKPLNRPPMSKAREVRLEQNRKAARESRRRKKIMVDELQRSVLFFNRANTTLKQQNEELERLLLQAQSQIQSGENGQNSQALEGVSYSRRTTTANDPQGNTAAAALGSGSNLPLTEIEDARTKESRNTQVQQVASIVQAQQMNNLSSLAQQTQAHHAAQFAATQAMFESQGFPPAAARAAAQTFVAAPKDANDATTASTELNLASAQTQGAGVMAANPWPFLVTLAPGQIQFASSVQQPVAMTGAGSKQGLTTGKTDLNPYFALQMPPFLTALLGNNSNLTGLNLPMIQLAGLNNGNETIASSLTSNSPVATNQNSQLNSIPTNAHEVQDKR